MKILFSGLVAIFFLFSFQLPMFAEGFDVNTYNQSVNSNESITDEGPLSSFTNSVSGWMPSAYTIGVNVITLIFIAGVIGMIMSMILRNGEWMKWATNTMIFSFIAILIIRVGPVFLLTGTLTDFTLLVSDVVLLLQEVSLYLAFGMFLVAAIVKMFYQMHDHQDYFRWQRGLKIGAFLMGTLSLFIPYVFHVI
ncbi:hypothetical protein [Desertibacillus haloalkaliphilus]|uniref:hypothetical protein n=1 Tax=Desertibacillus haloalkaliphilus TaxID=1328930 RepID=UPI001C25CBFF|nr:hypothetical protein [Desertibacillus haloalkaliphilus]MBU8908166.1 hypothetical protein [Desertibacillus haloalkaliphilus]